MWVVGWMCVMDDRGGEDDRSHNAAKIASDRIFVVAVLLCIPHVDVLHRGIVFMIAIIDYGMGNLRSVLKAFEAVGHQAVVTRDKGTIQNASHVVLPGVGAFGNCMANLRQYGLIEPIKAAIQSGKPFLGICLGFQLLFTESEEFGRHEGLDILQGKVGGFPKEQALKVPHTGWNQANIQRLCPLFKGIADRSDWYFVHSFFVDPRDKQITATTTTYGIPFTSSIWKDNVVACQFHPEKSQAVGLQLIKNFGDWQ